MKYLLGNLTYATHPGKLLIDGQVVGGCETVVTFGNVEVEMHVFGVKASKVDAARVLLLSVHINRCIEVLTAGVGQLPTQIQRIRDWEIPAGGDGHIGLVKCSRIDTCRVPRCLV